MSSNHVHDLDALQRILSAYVPNAQPPQSSWRHNSENNASQGNAAAAGFPVVSAYGSYAPSQQQPSTAAIANDHQLWCGTSAALQNSQSTTPYVHQLHDNSAYQPPVAHSSNPYNSIPSQLHQFPGLAQALGSQKNMSETPLRSETPQYAQPPQPMQTQTQEPLRPDPRTITEWSTAIKYLTKLAARNQDLGKSIQKLISNQHDNERRWWASREALIEKQAARVEGKRKLDDVLRSVGADSSIGTAQIDDVEELKQYDLKVYRASLKMSEAIDADLQVLGIPFFGTKPELISDTTPLSRQLDLEPGRTITKAELRDLQKRMFQQLEDMYNE